MAYIPHVICLYLLVTDEVSGRVVTKDRTIPETRTRRSTVIDLQDKRSTVPTGAKSAKKTCLIALWDNKIIPGTTIPGTIKYTKFQNSSYSEEVVLNVSSHSWTQCFELKKACNPDISEANFDPTDIGYTIERITVSEKNCLDTNNGDSFLFPEAKKETTTLKYFMV